MSTKQITRNTFIKNVAPSKYRALCDLLRSGEVWKSLACFIQKRGRDEPKFTTQDIQNFERSSCPAESLLNAWSTDRPDIGALIGVLEQANLHQMVHFIYSDILTDSTFERSRSSSSDEEVTYIPYDTLSAWTNAFNTRPLRAGGNLIGEGGFGHVFLGKTDLGSTSAVKRLEKFDANLQRQFAAELQALSIYKHDNLLRLLGYCNDPCRYCLVYEYMERGSLFDHLICKHGLRPLAGRQRLQIIVGAARGLHFLHTYQDKPLVHRDVKSPNILLDVNYEAKLGDFGLARLVHGELSAGTTHTQLLVGTLIYMPPEYLDEGEVSVKTDSYSFGLVLLETVTGLPVKDTNRFFVSLGAHVRAYREDLINLIDDKAGVWNPQVCQQILNLAAINDKCLIAPRTEHRLTVTEVLPMLESFLK